MVVGAIGVNEVHWNEENVWRIWNLDRAMGKF